MEPPKQSEGVVEELRYYKSLVNQRLNIAGAQFHPAPDASTFQLKLLKTVTESNYNSSATISDLYLESENRLKKVNLVAAQEPPYEIDSVSPKTGLYVFRVKRDGEKVYFETWSSSRILDSQLVTDRLEFIYNDDVFGSVSWSDDEKRVVFIAEKKPDKEVKLQDLNISDRNKDAEKDVNLYLGGRAERTNFGEALATKKQPEVWVYNLESKQLGKVTNIDYQKWNPGFPTFHGAEGLLFSSHKRVDPQFGLRSCLNRDSSLWYLETMVLKTGNEEPKKEGAPQPVELVPSYFSAKRPIVTSDGKNVVFYGLKSPILEHMTAMELCVLPLPEKGTTHQPKEPRVLIPVIEDNLDVFNGLFTEHSFIRKTFLLKLSDGSDRIIFDTVFRGLLLVFAIDPVVGKLEVIRSHRSGSTFTLLASNSVFGAIIAEINSKSIRKLHFVSPKNYQEYFGPVAEAGSDAFQSLFKENVFYNFMEEEVPRMSPVQTILFKKIAAARSRLIRIDSGAEGMLWLPKQSEEAPQKFPLILNIHGGPHAFGLYNMFTGFDLGLFLNAGYAVFIPNYTGSQGFGLKFLRGCLGKAGSVELNDCIGLIDKILKELPEEIDASRIASTGYSYGGYLTACLAVHPEFSKRLKVAVPFNAVIDMPSFLGSSDIPEWAFAESQGLGRPLDYQLSDAELAGMWRSSPLSQAKNVQCPMLIMVGQADLRVPPKNGIVFYRALKSMGKPNIEMNVYPGENHSLPGVEANLHSVITMMRFLKKHL